MHLSVLHMSDRGKEGDCKGHTQGFPKDSTVSEVTNGVCMSPDGEAVDPVEESGSHIVFCGHCRCVGVQKVS